MSKLYVLTGEHPDDGPQQQYFVEAERETALHVASCWQKRGWSPKLIAKTHDQPIAEVLFDWFKARWKRMAA